MSDGFNPKLLLIIGAACITAAVLHSITRGQVSGTTLAGLLIGAVNIRMGWKEIG